MRATNWSCSHCARSTHSTSSNRSSSWLPGVRRFRLRSGRCTMTCRSLPTSEWTPTCHQAHPSRSTPFSSARHDVRAGGSCHHRVQLFERADHGALPAGVDKPDGGVDFRSHRAGGERDGPQLVGGHAVEASLARRAPVEVHAVDVGGHHVQVRVELLRQQARGEVLVDHGLDADEPPVLARGVHRRDAAASRADDDHAALDQPAHRADLEDPLRLRAKGRRDASTRRRP